MSKKSRNRSIKLIIGFSAIVLIAITLIVLNNFIPIRYLGAYINCSADKNPGGRLRIRYIDVGFGNCTLIELPDGKTMLIDGGTGTYSQSYNVLRTLNAAKIDNIDYLVCTNVNSEHCGGLTEIIKYKSVTTAFVPYVENINLTDEYAAFYGALKLNCADIRISESGMGEINTDAGYWFGILSPEARGTGHSEYDAMNTSPTKANIKNASCVIWLDYCGKGFIFLGDADSTVQDKLAWFMLMENMRASVNGSAVKMSPCAALCVADHGGDGSFNATLCDLLSPQSAIISVGENSFGCPSLQVIADLRLYVHDSYYRTDINGTITVTVTADDFLISKEK